MLDLPGMVVAQPVGQLDLVERVLVEPVLVALLPGPRQLQLVENPELHARLLLRPVVERLLDESILHRLMRIGLAQGYDDGVDAAILAQP